MLIVTATGPLVVTTRGAEGRAATGLGGDGGGERGPINVETCFTKTGVGLFPFSPHKNVQIPGNVVIERECFFLFVRMCQLLHHGTSLAKSAMPAIDCKNPATLY